MGDDKETIERKVADRFFDWLKNQSGPEFVFSRRAGEAPDLVYVSGTDQLQVEVTTAYYDGTHAKFLWDFERGAENPPAGWHGVGNPHRALADEVLTRLRDKCGKRYGGTTILLILIPPGLTSADDLWELVSAQTLPSVIPYLGVYVVGRFPISTSRPTSVGDYRVLPVKEYWPLPGPVYQYFPSA